MKRGIPAALAVLLLLALPAGANSAPVHWEGTPASGVLAVDENCPITVSHEDLTFALDTQHRDGYSPVARVEAAYRMENPTGEDLAVGMAFPVEERAREFDPTAASITADGARVPFRLCFGDTLYEGYTPTAFDPQAVGTVYTLTAAPGDWADYTEVRFRPAEGQKAFLGRGDLRGYGSYEDGTYTVSVQAGGSAEIFAFGGELAFTAVQGEFSQSGEEADFASFFDGCLRELDYYGRYAPDHAEDLRAAKYLGLNQLWTDADFTLMEELEQYANVRQRISMVYAVDFPAGAERTVSVAYRAAGEADRRETRDWTAAFTYLLQPARSWASFGTLDLTVYTGGDFPYVVDSSIPLEREAEGKYAARLDGLPEGDLVFTLYSQPEITVADRAAGALSRNYMALPLLLLAAGAAAAVIAVVLVRRSGRKKAS